MCATSPPAAAAAAHTVVQVAALRSEHERSVYFPKPAPPGSALHRKLLAAAAGAIAHGQFSAARECLEAGGEWEALMAVAVAGGDFDTLRGLASGLQVRWHVLQQPFSAHGRGCECSSSRCVCVRVLQVCDSMTLCTCTLH